MKVDMGVCRGKPVKITPPLASRRRRNFVIFALTPGIPHEYVNRVFGITDKREKTWLRRLCWRNRHKLEALAIENAATITVQDGYAMLLAMPEVRSPIPHWSHLALQHMLRTRQKSAKQIATELGVGVDWVRHRARISHFDPLTLQRITSSHVPKHYRKEHGDMPFDRSGQQKGFRAMLAKAKAIS